MPEEAQADLTDKDIKITVFNMLKELKKYTQYTQKLK